MGFWSFITGTTPQSEQDAQLAAAKAKYQTALDNRVADGTITSDQAAADQTYVNDLQLQDTTSAAEQGFVEGAQEGLQNVLQAPGKAIGAIGSGSGTVLAGILKGFPWWFWVVLAGAAFFWFASVGGLVLFRGRNR